MNQTMNDLTSTAGNPEMAAELAALVCPCCGSPETRGGQPSKRIFFGCESYTYDGERKKLRDQTEVCRLRESMQEAWKLVNAMAGQEYWQRAEDWLAENRQFAPEGIILSNVKDHGSLPGASVANREDAE